MFENEVVTPEWLMSKGAVQHDKRFYLHGFCNGRIATLVFYPDALSPDAIASWAIVDRNNDPCVWLPTNRVEDFGEQRVLLSRFWGTVLMLGIAFKAK